MLVDKIENTAIELKQMQERLVELDKEYRNSFDRQVREELMHVRKEITKKRHQFEEEIYLNLEELKLIKKHFPALFEVFLEDEAIGNIIKKKEWLLELKKVPQKDLVKKLHEVRQKRKQLKEAKDFLKKWVGKIDSKSLSATWNVLKDILKGEVEKDEALSAIEEADKKLKKEGWLILLNEPFILRPLHKFFTLLKRANEYEYEKSIALEKTKGKGTLAEYRATEELRNAKKRRRKIERICRHILLANQNFLNKLKKQKMIWGGGSSRDKSMKKFLEKIEIKPIDEKKWLKEMKKKLEA